MVDSRRRRRRTREDKRRVRRLKGRRTVGGGGGGEGGGRLYNTIDFFFLYLSMGTAALGVLHLVFRCSTHAMDTNRALLTHFTLDSSLSLFFLSLFLSFVSSSPPQRINSMCTVELREERHLSPHASCRCYLPSHFSLALAMLSFLPGFVPRANNLVVFSVC